MRKLLLINSVSLPVRTGPSFTAIQRSRMLSQHYDVTIAHPFITPFFQRYAGWPLTFQTKEIYLHYLKQTYTDCPNAKHILYEARHVPVLNWNTMKSFDFAKKYDIVIFEDSANHTFLNFPLIKQINKFVDSGKTLICIHHTDFAGIMGLDSFKGWEKVVEKGIETKGLNIFISKRIYNKAQAKNGTFLPVHGIHNDFFTKSQLPLGDDVYYMGKLDNIHKKCNQITDWTKDICKLHVWGKGPEENQIKSMEHTIFHGLTSNPIEATKNCKIYISASETEGICTATAEALAMHKFALIPECLCNKIFKGITNVFFYKNKKEFQSTLKFLLNKKPEYEKGAERFQWERANVLLLNTLQRLENSQTSAKKI